jgi:hypothetical protein
MILRSNILNGLSVVSENIDSDNGMVKVRVCALKNFIVLMLFIVQSLKSSKQEFKDTSQVLWGRCGHKYVAKTVYYSTSD